MRVALGLVARADNGSSASDRRAAVDQAVRWAHSLIAYALPARPSDVRLSSWFSDDHSIALLTWDNEASADFGFGHRGFEDHAVSLIGYAEGEALQRLEQNPDASVLQVSTELSGCFAVLRANGDRVDAATDATRSNGLYLADSPRLRIISSRALLSHLLQQADLTGNEDPTRQMDLVALRHMALGGYFLGGLTPYQGVTALSTAEHVSIDRWFARRDRRPALAPAPQEWSPGDWASLVQEVSDALVEAFDPIPGHQLSLSLTGGRDSRLLAAALTNRPDFSVETATMGMPSDPDVVIAQELSAIMGAPHHVNAPGGVVDHNRIRAEDPLSRIVRALDVHDAMTSGWDDIEDYGPMMPTPRLSGVGGEILRGGLVFPEMDTLDPEEAARRLNNLMTGGSFFTQPYMESARAWAGPLLQLAQEDAHAAVDDFYYEHRNGRWVSARRAGARFRRHSYDPLLDNKFVRLVRRLPAQLRWSERLAFDVIATLAPHMRDVPIEGSRWRFERSAPSPTADPSEAANWDQRQALVRTATTSSYSWNRLQDAQVRSRIKEVILDGTHGPAVELFDRPALERYLSPQEYRYPTTVWHIATTVVMLTMPWYKTLRLPRVPSIDIEVPVTSPS